MRQRIDTAKKTSTPRGKIESNFRARIFQTIKRGSKGSGGHTFDILGYTSEDLRVHIERQFEPWMTWENYRHDTWHIDHIIPLSAFNYETPYDIDFKKAWALSNLRPLAANDNMKKGDRLLSPFQPSLALAVG
ncbi:HNH endonuclease [Mesorhizobium sp. NZP2298]|nr:HNH endonuclease [Mesorhizobium sp. NZP2298]